MVYDLYYLIVYLLSLDFLPVPACQCDFQQTAVFQQVTCEPNQQFTLIYLAMDWNMLVLLILFMDSTKSVQKNSFCNLLLFFNLFD